MEKRDTLSYEIHGDKKAPIVVFLHGFMGDCRDWDEVVGLLKNDFCCVTIDLPGHGKSADVPEEAFTFPGAAQRISNVLKSIASDDPSILGYSMGGRVALYFALHHSHLCRHLIIESATPGIISTNNRVKRLVWDEKNAKKLEQGLFEDFLREWYDQPLFKSLTKSPEILDNMMARRRRNDPQKLAKVLRKMSVGGQTPMWDYLPKLNMPVLLLAGKEDSKYTSITRDMAKLLPFSKVNIIAGANHNIHLENPKELAKCVQGFLLKN